MKIPKLNDVKYYKTFREMIDSLCTDETKPAISWFTRKGEEQGVDYGRLYSDVLGLKESLCSRGLAGRHIAVLGENSYEWLLAYFAATYCGATIVCIDVEQSDETIEQMLTMADVDAMFCAKQFIDICKKWATGGQSVFSMQGTDESSMAHLISEGNRMRQEGLGNVVGQAFCAAELSVVTDSYVLICDNAVELNVFACAGIRPRDQRSICPVCSS